MEGLNEAETGEQLTSGFRIQKWGEILDGDADLNRGDWYGQGSEGAREGTKICSPSYLLQCLFLECKFFSKAEIIPAFALAWCLALYCMQYSSTRQQMQLILCQRIIYDAITDFVRRAFNELFHFDMLKSTILKSENIWFTKILLITAVIDF